MTELTIVSHSDSEATASAFKKCNTVLLHTQ